MSYITNLRDSCSDLKDRILEKYSSLRHSGKKRYSKSRNYLSNKHGVSREGIKSKYNKYTKPISSKKRGFQNKLGDKWQNTWSTYANYFVWGWTPWVLAYGTIWAAGSWGLGLIEPYPRYIIGAGIAWYGIKQELPELYHAFKGRSQIEG